MTDKQAAYEAKRREVTGQPAVQKFTYRVTLPDGTEVIERVIGLSEIAAYYPQARAVVLLPPVGAFW